jgi:hypothetical protein
MSVVFIVLVRLCTSASFASSAVRGFFILSEARRFHPFRNASTFSEKVGDIGGSTRACTCTRPGVSY